MIKKHKLRMFLKHIKIFCNIFKLKKKIKKYKWRKKIRNLQLTILKNDSHNKNAC